MAPDSPQVIPETACNSSSWKWWPGTESNHRHADLQYDGKPGSATESRRKGSWSRRADRTEPLDRAHAEHRRTPTERARRRIQASQWVAPIATERGPNLAARCRLTSGRTCGTISRSSSHSNVPRMAWYFSMYQRFSLLYFGIATGRTPDSSAIQRQGQITDSP